jgi:hypothetical protein
MLIRPTSGLDDPDEALVRAEREVGPQQPIERQRVHRRLAQVPQRQHVVVAHRPQPAPCRAETELSYPARPLLELLPLTVDLSKPELLAEDRGGNGITGGTARDPHNGLVEHPLPEELATSGTSRGHHVPPGDHHTLSSPFQRGVHHHPRSPQALPIAGAPDGDLAAVALVAARDQQERAMRGLLRLQRGDRFAVRAGGKWAAIVEAKYVHRPGVVPDCHPDSVGVHGGRGDPSGQGEGSKLSACWRIPKREGTILAADDDQTPIGKEGQKGDLRGRRDLEEQARSTGIKSPQHRVRLRSLEAPHRLEGRVRRQLREQWVERQGSGLHAEGAPEPLILEALTGGDELHDQWVELGAACALQGLRLAQLIAAVEDARVEAAVPPDEQIERLRVERRVSDALSGLPETERRVVELHYYEELSGSRPVGSRRRAVAARSLDDPNDRALRAPRAGKERRLHAPALGGVELGPMLGPIEFDERSKLKKIGP